ncbi:glycosyltransferase [Luteimonas sp. MJ293]|uniref:glycosyltransferase family 2 protein n=1 Tax=Luteimonas sp. MJ146 TaxID=3129240 RepID=UPI0031BA8019
MTTGTAHPLVSVCIANYDGEDLLPDCLDSILAQDAGVATEILVHDDASRDGSLDLLTRKYPQARVIRSPENVGFCVANNRMAAAARGNYILLLNNDAALMPDAIATLLALSKRSPDTILTLPQYAWDDGNLINMGSRLDLFYNAVPVMQDAGAPLAMAEGACLFLERSLWERLGGFPEFFGSIAEDAYLCCAALLAGTRIVCAGNSGYRHRQGASFGGNRIQGRALVSRYRRRYLSERNRIALLASCTPTWLVWPWLGVHLLQLLAEGALLCVSSRRLDPWHRIYSPALGSAWGHRQSTMRLRRTVQAHRRVGLVQYLKSFTFVPQRLRLLARHGMPRLGD